MASSDLAFTHAAIADLDDIWMAVARSNGIEVADRILDDLFATCDRVALFPGLGRAAVIGRHREVRAVGQSRWLILYTAEDESVLIRRVLDGARDLRGVELDPPVSP